MKSSSEIKKLQIHVDYILRSQSIRYQRNEQTYMKSSSKVYGKFGIVQNHLTFVFSSTNSRGTQAKVLLTSDHETLTAVSVFCNKVGLSKASVFEVGVVSAFTRLCAKRDKTGVIHDLKTAAVSHLWLPTHIPWVASYNRLLTCWECNEGVKVGGHTDDIRLQEQSTQGQHRPICWSLEMIATKWLFLVLPQIP